MSVKRMSLKPALKKYVCDLLSIDGDNINSRDEQRIFDYLINLSGVAYRQVKSRKTLKITLGDDYFIKIHQPLSFKEKIKNFLKFNWESSHALDEERAIDAVKKLKIQTLEVAGFGEAVYKGGTSSFLITEAIEPNLSLDKLLETKLNDPDYFKLKRVLIKFIAQTTRLLHRNGLNHRDYYACHYLLKLPKQESEYVIAELLVDKFTQDLYLIDLHRMQVRIKTPIRYIIKDLSSILFSIKNFNFTKTDYLRFVRYYNDHSDLQGKLQGYRNDLKFWSKVILKASRLREKG